MPFMQGSTVAGTLILALTAWLLAGTPQPEALWPYLLYGAVFIILLAHLIHVGIREALSVPVALAHGVPLALAAYWLGATPYRWLEYACWINAALYAILIPRMVHAVQRMERHAAGAPAMQPPQRAFDVRDLGIATLLVVAISGLIMTTRLVAHEFGLYAAIAAFVLWPVSLLVVPWYAALAHADWLIVTIVQGGGLVGALLYRGARGPQRADTAQIAGSLREEP
jgi:hypothetical protein